MIASIGMKVTTSGSRSYNNKGGATMWTFLEKMGEPGPDSIPVPWWWQGHWVLLVLEYEKLLGKPTTFWGGQ